MNSKHLRTHKFRISEKKEKENRSDFVVVPTLLENVLVVADKLISTPRNSGPKSLVARSGSAFGRIGDRFVLPRLRHSARRT